MSEHEQNDLTEQQISEGEAYRIRYGLPPSLAVNLARILRDERRAQALNHGWDDVDRCPDCHREAPCRCVDCNGPTRCTDYIHCPECHQPAPYTNCGRAHVGYCKTCQVSWLVGSNLFSSWKRQTEDEQRAAWEHHGIEHMRWVGALA